MNRRIAKESARSASGFVLLAVFAMVFAVPSAPVQAGDPCGGQGMASLSMIGDVVPAPGTAFRIQISGLPLAPFALILDFGPGPVEVPSVGTMCLDLGPRRRIVFDGIRTGSPILGIDGLYTTTLKIPPRAHLGGRQFYAQAIIQDPAAPNGFAISNLMVIDVHPTLLETFDTVGQREHSQTSALWGDGELVGLPIAGPRLQTHTPGESSYLLSHPLVEAGNPWTVGARMHMIFQPNEVRAVPGESILAMEWAPTSGFTFASTYMNAKLMLDHVKDTPPDGIHKTFAFNYDERDGVEPQVMWQGDFSVANGNGVEWAPWPSFDAPFEYDTGRPLLFEWDMPQGGDTYQLFRNESTFYVPFSRVFGDGGADRAISWGENTSYWTRFTFMRDRAIARSRWFLADSENPDYHTPYIVSLLPPGTAVEVQYEGTRDESGDGIPDGVHQTGFKNDVNEIDGFPFLRFRVTMRPTDDDQVAIVKSISIPYTP